MEIYITQLPKMFSAYEIGQIVGYFDHQYLKKILMGFLIFGMRRHPRKRENKG